MAVSVSLARGLLGAQAAAALDVGASGSGSSAGGVRGADNDQLSGDGFTRSRPGSERSDMSSGPPGKRRLLEPPFTEGDILAPHKPLPASSSLAPLLPVKPHRFQQRQAEIPPPALNRLEIVRRLGTGSYAVVYLVREVLDEAESDDLEWELESEDGIVGLGAGTGRGRQYGREFGELASLPPAVSSALVLPSLLAAYSLLLTYIAPSSSLPPYSPKMSKQAQPQ